MAGKSLGALKGQLVACTVPMATRWRNERDCGDSEKNGSLHDDGNRWCIARGIPDMKELCE